MPSLKQIEDQALHLIEQQKRVVEDDSRDWADRKPEFDKMDEDIKSLLEQHGALKKVDENPFGKVEDAKPEDKSPKSIGEQFAAADGYKNAVGRKGSRFTTGQVEVKATLSGGAGGSGLLVPTFLPGVTNILFQRLTVADLFPGGTTAGRTITYLKESTVTNAASSVAEGGLKPASDLNTSQVSENYTKAATTLKIADEMLEDVPFVVSYVNGRLMLFVQIEEEALILRANGVAPEFTGLLNRTGLTAAQAKGGDTTPDALYKEITKIRVNAFVEPNAIVMHPNDWQDLRLLKDGQQQYYAGGPFTGAYGNGAPTNDSGNLASGQDIWGKPVVVTTAMTENTALVGAFNTCAQLFRKGGVTVEMTNSNEDDFLHDLVAVRAESRIALAVYRPAGFGTVTGI